VCIQFVKSGRRELGLHINTYIYCLKGVNILFETVFLDLRSSAHISMLRYVVAEGHLHSRSAQMQGCPRGACCANHESESTEQAGVLHIEKCSSNKCYLRIGDARKCGDLHHTGASESGFAALLCDVWRFYSPTFSTAGTAY
jgi:hypothetical protein